MKRIHILSMFASLLAMFVVLPSCKDDDKNDDSGNNNDDQPASVVTIDNDILTGGLSTDLNSAVLELPINCDGEWHITMDKGTNWAQILDWKVLYNGKQTISIAVDENSTGAGRSTTINVSDSDGNIKTITLHQLGNSDSNGSGENFAKAGFGCGIDYDYVLNTKAIAAQVQSGEKTTKFEPTKIHKSNNLFNITAIQQLQNTSNYPLDQSAYVESSIKMANMEAVLFDSSVVQKKTLKVELSLDLQFGPIEFSAGGHYNSTKDESRAKIDYVIERVVPMYNVYLSPAELGAYAAMHGMDENENLDAQFDAIDKLIDRYNKINTRKKLKNLNEDGLTEAQEAEINAMYDAMTYQNDFAGIYSASFTQRLNQLYQALGITGFRGTKKDIDKAKDVLRAIDADYGPFFISGGDFGGSIAMHCVIDTMHLVGVADLGGYLALAAGMVNAKGTFEYNETGENLLRNSKLNTNIYGGNADETTNRMLSTATGGSATNLTQWQYILQDWVSSMWSESDDSPKRNMAAPISFTIAPIWEVIENATAKQFAKDFFMTEYKERNIELYFGIMKGDYKVCAADLLNQE